MWKKIAEGDPRWLSSARFDHKIIIDHVTCLLFARTPYIVQPRTTKIINENLLKLDEIQNLASATSKMTS